MVYVIAAYHDLGLCKGREFHHMVSGEILMADEMLCHWFVEVQMNVFENIFVINMQKTGA